MSTDIVAVARAFSSHRFDETYEHLAPQVRWVAVGQSTTRGRDDVIAVCSEAAQALAATRTEFTRFVTVADNDSVAIDATARYTDDDGNASVVSSCDIYEFESGELTTITSYAVELTDHIDQDDPDINPATTPTA